jgi:putative membrane protein
MLSEISQKVGLRWPKSRAGWLISLTSLLVLLVVMALFWLPAERPAGQLDVSALPLLNASLNGASAILLLSAYLFIRRRQVKWHRRLMLAAFVLSILFLLSYLTLHAVAGSTSFTGQGWIRPVYFSILISHIIFAAVVPPLALTTLYRAWQGTFSQHRRIAAWTLPIWLYVSLTGVAIYLLLYHLN